MKFLIVIPAHNEEENLPTTLSALSVQSHRDFELVIVNDGSTDKTQEIIQDFIRKDGRFSTVNLEKSAHQPGSKVVNAFNKGLATKTVSDFDIICKFDADIILEPNYLAEIADSFKNNPSYGLVGGLLFVEKNGDWVYEGNSNKNHVRGPLKAYRKECFDVIGGLRETLGWDNIDSILLENLGWREVVLPHLQVKLVKVKGADYTVKPSNYYGRYFYFLGLKRILAYVAAAKEASKLKSPSFFFQILKAYESARAQNLPLKISKDEQKVINEKRWEMLKKKWLKV